MSPRPAAGAVTLRPAAPSDHGPVTRLVAGAGLPLAGIAPDLDGFVVAEAGEEIVGTAGLEVHGDAGILRSLAVRPDTRGRGLGSRLTEGVLDVARSRSLRRVWLLTTTAEDFFPRHGFRPAEREDAPPGVRDSVEFREACPASAVAMTLDLTA